MNDGGTVGDALCQQPGQPHRGLPPCVLRRVRRRGARGTACGGATRVGPEDDHSGHRRHEHGGHDHQDWRAAETPLAVRDRRRPQAAEHRHGQVVRRHRTQAVQARRIRVVGRQLPTVRGRRPRLRGRRPGRRPPWRIPGFPRRGLWLRHGSGQGRQGRRQRGLGGGDRGQRRRRRLGRRSTAGGRLPAGRAEPRSRLHGVPARGVARTSFTGHSHSRLDHVPALANRNAMTAVSLRASATAPCSSAYPTSIITWRPDPHRSAGDHGKPCRIIAR
jgi:hypothetical protein